VRQVLSRTIGSIAATDSAISLASSALGSTLTAVAQSTGQQVTPLKDEDIHDRAKAERKLLVAFAENDTLSQRLHAALEANRHVMVEPVTTALIMAGIFVLLQTSVDVEITNENGTTKSKVQIKNPRLQNL
jgi:hypothetical protein